MRVLQVVPLMYPSQAGGPANSVYWLACGLKSVGVTTDVISTDVGIPKSIPESVWRSEHYGSVYYAKSPTRDRFSSFSFDYFREGLKLLSKYDVIHFHSLFYLPNVLLSSWVRLRNKTIIISPRGELDTQALVFSPKRKRIVIQLYRWLSHSTVCFHVTSEAEEQRVKTIFGDNACTQILANYMVLPRGVPLTAQKYFLYIGRIHPKKAIENLIEAVKQSTEFLNGNFSLLIAGSFNSDYGKELISLVNKIGLGHTISFVGHLEGDEKDRLIREAYMLVLPSHTENFGNVVVEAISRSVPVIASYGTPWSILEANNAGFWVANSSSSLACTLDKAITMDYEDFCAMRKCASDLAVSEFDIYRNIKKYVSFYSNVMKMFKIK